jgi:hypothetical protein
VAGAGARRYLFPNIDGKVMFPPSSVFELASCFRHSGNPLMNSVRGAHTKNLVGTTAAGMRSSFWVREIVQTRSCPCFARLCGANKPFLISEMHLQVHEYACSDSVIIKSSESQ